MQINSLSQQRLCTWPHFESEVSNVCEAATLGSLINDDGDGNGFRMAKQQLCTCITLFLYISLSSLHDYNVEVPKFTFYRGGKHTTTTFFFFS